MKFVDVIGDTYRVIRGYLSREQALEMANSLRNNDRCKQLKNSGGVNGLSTNVYKDAYMCAVAAEKVAHLNSIMGGPKLLPTYTYSRIYLNGSSLEKHKDRVACEVSLSIHLDGDAPSAFYILDKNGDTVSVDLEPGDAILYDGPNATHWREVYDGEEYIQTFHHYVFLGGDNENEFKLNTGSLVDYIKVYRGQVDPKVCQDIIDVISNEYSDRWSLAQTVDANTGVRVCESLELRHSDPIDEIIFKEVNKALGKFTLEYPDFQLSGDEGYTCLRYFPGGKYNYHTDQHQQFNREVTIIINLNDEYEGGELHHFRGDTNITKLGVGDICIFPSNYMFPHKISEVESGCRYSIVTWSV